MFVIWFPHVWKPISIISQPRTGSCRAKSRCSSPSHVQLCGFARRCQLVSFRRDWTRHFRWCVPSCPGRSWGVDRRSLAKRVENRSVLVSWRSWWVTLVVPCGTYGNVWHGNTCGTERTLACDKTIDSYLQYINQYPRQSTRQLQWRHWWPKAPVELFSIPKAPKPWYIALLHSFGLVSPLDSLSQSWLATAFAPQRGSSFQPKARGGPFMSFNCPNTSPNTTT